MNLNVRATDWVGGQEEEKVFAMSTLHDWVPDPGSITLLASVGRSEPQRPARAGEPCAAQLPADAASSSLLRPRSAGSRNDPHDDLHLGGPRSVRSPRHGLRDQRPPPSARHLPQWFEYKDADNIVRRTIADPAEIEFVPIQHKEMTTAELRDHISAPHPLQWGCFLFGVIQSADHFTFYASIGHLCVDLMIVPVLFTELHTMYTDPGAGRGARPAAGGRQV